MRVESLKTTLNFIFKYLTLNIPIMNKALSIAAAALIGCASINAEAQTMIGKTTNVAAISKGDRMTPETLWAMGRVGGAAASPDGKTVVYQVGYYSVKENKSHQMI